MNTHGFAILMTPAPGVSTPIDKTELAALGEKMRAAAPGEIITFPHAIEFHLGFEGTWIRSQDLRDFLAVAGQPDDAD